MSVCAINKSDGVKDFMCDLQSEGDRRCENETMTKQTIKEEIPVTLSKLHRKSALW